MLGKEIWSIILAAGKSERMGSCKPLLTIAGTTFIEHLFTAFKDSDIGENLRIIIGFQAEKILSSTSIPERFFILNENYEGGQLSSLKVGIEALKYLEPDGILVHPVDHPLLKVITINALLQAFNEKEKLIVAPRYRGERGRPVIFSWKLIPEILLLSSDSKPRDIISRHQEEMFLLDVDDEGILLGINTPEDYQKVLKNAQ
ncbi:MAG: nucleotidyltransferase family protein [Acidobacteriota bacterium]